MHRYGSQVLGLAGCRGDRLGAAVASRSHDRVAPAPRDCRCRRCLASSPPASCLLARDVVAQLADRCRAVWRRIRRAWACSRRARFSLPGEWRWGQPWQFFRTGFFVGVIALVPFAVRIVRERRAGRRVAVLFALVTLVATIGQNRFGYYLVSACALIGGWLATRILDWGGVAHAENRTPQARTRCRSRAIWRSSPSRCDVRTQPGAGLLLAAAQQQLSAVLARRDAWLRNAHAAAVCQSSGHDETYYFARYPRGGRHR